jgi:hypothetical protein
MNSRSRFRILTTVALALAACGGPAGEGEGEGEGERLDADAFVGIYEVSSFLRNEAGCDAPGDEQLGDLGETFFFLDTRSVFGLQLAEVFSCASVEDCQDKRARFADGQPFGSSFNFSFDRGDSGGLAGQTFSTGFSSGDGTCTSGGVTDATLDPGEADAVLIETRARLADYPADDEGFCTTDAAERAAADVDCGELETVEAALVAPL